ncbi:MAG TPA: carboxypeptidase regulatory-like domain-containing protein [Candidatus Binatia bacterium]|jgi:hypothetical protein|nr:carboxypeptidase regulatory-like domain-containing protein [Candidatus Binatia bacterium]
MKKIVIGTVGLFLFAVEPVFPGFSDEFPESQPQVKSYNGIPYLSGGIGIEERENMRALSKEDNLVLSFALQNKEYLGDAKVLIKDDKGKKVLEAESDGPLFFAKLPAGNYTVEATAMEKPLEQVAHVPSKGQVRLYFTWKKSDHETATG